MARCFYLDFIDIGFGPIPKHVCASVIAGLILEGVRMYVQPLFLRGGLQYAFQHSFLLVIATSLCGSEDLMWGRVP